jgi:hypothetical protein
MTDDQQAPDEKYYPYWEEVYRLLKDNGFNFTCDYSAQDNKAVYELIFAESDQVYAAMNLLREHYDPNIVYSYEAFDEDLPGRLWIDQLPYWYPVSPDDLKALLGETKDFLTEHRELVGDFIDTAEGEEDAAVWRRINNTMYALIRRLEKVMEVNG